MIIFKSMEFLVWSYVLDVQRGLKMCGMYCGIVSMSVKSGILVACGQLLVMLRLDPLMVYVWSGVTWLQRPTWRSFVSLLGLFGQLGINGSMIAQKFKQLRLWKRLAAYLVTTRLVEWLNMAQRLYRIKETNSGLDLLKRRWNLTLTLRFDLKCMYDSFCYYILLVQLLKWSLIPLYLLR